MLIVCCTFFSFSLSYQSGVLHHGMAHRCVREHVQQRCDAVSGDALGVTDRLDRQVLTRTPTLWLHPRAHDLCVCGYACVREYGVCAYVTCVHVCDACGLFSPSPLLPLSFASHFQSEASLEADIISGQRTQTKLDHRFQRHFPTSLHIKTIKSAGTRDQDHLPAT